MNANSDAFAALSSTGHISAWGCVSCGGSGAPTGGGYVYIASTIKAFAALSLTGTISAWGHVTYGGSTREMPTTVPSTSPSSRLAR